MGRRKKVVVNETPEVIEVKKYHPVYKCKICDSLFTASNQLVDEDQIEGLCSSIINNQESSIIPSRYYIHHCSANNNKGIAEFAGFIKDNGDQE